ncbi:MAG: ester cyclase [Saprospiraceae bacterium]|nr:ester cyclase [Saprospiraceae bacterium]MCF8248506.1 ester cyclase [Saprospiraceae bacterium]MCF8280577.1 ester cyclase [Bacteroidales bacterium]MCF8310240.1 ester cyclase [Saprospiraceae bacterium]MCF8439321.1 ester cyclase [Saprospiraceae bacterium]
MRNHHLLLSALVILMFTQCMPAKKLRQADVNKETIRLWYEEGWNKGQNEVLIPRVFHPDWSDGNPLKPESVQGIAGMYEVVKFYKDAFPDAHFTITHLFADDKNAALRYEVEATHGGDAFGIPATGKKFISTGLVVYEMKDGKIYRSWQELDLMGIMNQLKD